MESLEREENGKNFFCCESVMAHWTVARQAVWVLFLREFSYFPLFGERRLLVVPQSVFLWDWTNKSYGISLGRYAHRRNPVGASSGHT